MQPEQGGRHETVLHHQLQPAATACRRALLKSIGLSNLIAVLVLSASSFAAPTESAITAELAGNPLEGFPYFEYVRAFNEAPWGAEATHVWIAIDPIRFPGIVGNTCNIYVVEARTASEWAENRRLDDTDPVENAHPFESAHKVQGNIVKLTLPSEEFSSDAAPTLNSGN